MSEPYIGQVMMFAGNYAPKGWQFCQGQLLPISQYSALFSILGTTYGGNGTTTFALPDLRGRVPMQQGQGPGLTPRTLGEMSGSESVTLLPTQMPAHSHALAASSGQADSSSPQGTFNAVAVDPNTQQPVNLYGTTPTVQMAVSSVSQVGGSQPHENMQPFTCLNFIIALEGIYPSRP